ncbi:MAG: hypothetical protein C5B50_04255 [Verrucomicrobia bacterium]|nr:MAG: hypothetical protein C5B50_04255 [Verrucomicrobiota bacterium]
MRQILLAVCSVVALRVTVLATPSKPGPETSPPSSPREFFNAGTQKLREGKFREAEAFLESALASQNERLQPPSLYNLGHVRFQEGIAELKKGPSSKPLIARSQAASDSADEAMRAIDDALASDELDKMVAAYVRGRGARKELKAATAAVKRALEVHGSTLTVWQRASDDFKSSFELDPADNNAQKNAETVDRYIAKLVDLLREMQKCSNGMCNKSSGLGDKLKKLKGRIPAPNMPPGAGGDDDDDEDTPFGPKPGQEEGPSREGHEMMLTREQAGWLLDSFKLDSERRLPMGGWEPGKPGERARPTW